MTYYEELGVPPDAASGTIREAYRNVARLLHPDAQTDPVLKQFAEVQMKRINHLYEVLSDPEHRRRYDQELAGSPDRPGTIIIQAPPSSDQFEQHNSGGTFAWLLATAICATFIIWLATRESSAPAVYPQSSTVQRVAAAIRPKANSDRQRDDEIARLRAALAAANADLESLTKQLAVLQPARKFQPPPADTSQPPRASASGVASLTPAPLAAQSALLEFPLTTASPGPINPPAGPKSRWAGSWEFRRPKAENHNTAIFPPEFIQAVISDENGHLRGEYHARFKVGDARISPDVNFRFEGRVSGSSGRFQWTGNDGAKGEVQLRLVSDTSLEVAWKATSLGSSMGLVSGTAELREKSR